MTGASRQRIPCLQRMQIYEHSFDMRSRKIASSLAQVTDGRRPFLHQYAERCTRRNRDSAIWQLRVWRAEFMKPQLPSTSPQDLFQWQKILALRFKGFRLWEEDIAFNQECNDELQTMRKDMQCIFARNIVQRNGTKLSINAKHRWNLISQTLVFL